MPGATWASAYCAASKYRLQSTRLRSPLGSAIVAAEQLVHPRGVARAADVLQEERVVEVAAILERQADLVGEPHADQAAPQRVAEGLSFGEIERE
jgi:hypothetical protein